MGTRASGAPKSQPEPKEFGTSNQNPSGLGWTCEPEGAQFQSRLA
jgi:hypothetical protein